MEGSLKIRYTSIWGGRGHKWPKEISTSFMDGPILRRTRICINWNSLFQTSVHKNKKELFLWSKSYLTIRKQFLPLIGSFYFDSPLLHCILFWFLEVSAEILTKILLVFFFWLIWRHQKDIFDRKKNSSQLKKKILLLFF